MRSSIPPLVEAYVQMNTLISVFTTHLTTVVIYKTHCQYLSFFFLFITSSPPQDDYLQNVYDYIGWSAEPLDDYDGDGDSDSQPEGYTDGPLSDNLIQDFRPPHLEYRIGDIVFTRSLAIGVIVGWRIDLTVSVHRPCYQTHARTIILLRLYC